MALPVLEAAPPQFYRILQGLPVHPANGGPPDENENFRLFTMANFIYGSVAPHSAIWTDRTSASSPYLAATSSSHSLEGDNAHIPSYILAQDGSLPDERIAQAVRSALPLVPDVCARPSLRLPEMGVWSCPQCGLAIDPRDLTVDQKSLIAEHLGVGEDAGVVEHGDGRLEVCSLNPWRFMRCVDCLGWNHLAMHLRSECVILWFPSPATEYTSAPGLWWDEERLSRRDVYRPLRLEIEALQRTEGFKLRMWKAKKALTLAKKSLHAARFHLTRWRHDAVAARRTLVRQMFTAGRGIVDTGLALVAQMDRERVDPERTRWEAEREQSRALRREWEEQKES